VRALPLIVVGLVVLFAAGLIAPRKSVRLQRWMDDRLEEGQERSDRRWGKLGDWLATSLGWLQRAGDATAEAGRRLRERLS
jgi:di/tricarboxylate transporter